MLCNGRDGIESDVVLLSGMWRGLCVTDAAVPGSISTQTGLLLFQCNGVHNAFSFGLRLLLIVRWQ